MSVNSAPNQVLVSGAFDDLRSEGIRFLEEAAKLGEVTALLWRDELVRQLEGKAPKFPEAEREYLLRAIRWVRRVLLISRAPGCPLAQDRSGRASVPASPDFSYDLAGDLVSRGRLPYEGALALPPDVWVVREAESSEVKRGFCEARGLQYHVVRDQDLRRFPEVAPALPPTAPGRKRVMVTGCFDWVHSGHVRFFEEVSAYGDLYVVLGHDANLRLLKGAGHPLFPQEERRYVVGSIRHVTQALITTGHGWLDAEPEIQRLKPHIYAVNEDGDKGGKREYCAKMGIEYLVLKRTPAPGLPARTSTDLRGF